MLQRFVDAAAVEAEIERVRSLSGAALRRRWQSEFGRPLPTGLTIDLLRRMIANRIQEAARSIAPPSNCWTASPAAMAKKRGPFQTVPVMARAIADRLE